MQKTSAIFLIVFVTFCQGCATTRLTTAQSNPYREFCPELDYLDFIARSLDHARPDRQPERLIEFIKTHKLPAPPPLNISRGDLRTAIINGLNIGFLLRGLEERPLTVVKRTRRDRGNYIEKRLLFKDPFVGMFEALLLVEKGASFPQPAIVGLHGHHASAQNFARHCMGTDLVKSGHIVLIPEFRAMNCDAMENLISLALLRQGFTLMGLRVYEVLLAIKYLRSLSEVDAARIGIISHSGGSATANLVVRITDWIKVQVTDHEVDYHDPCEVPVHCETVPALYRLSSCINNGATLQIPRLRVPYNFKDAVIRDEILSFFIKGL